MRGTADSEDMYPIWIAFTEAEAQGVIDELVTLEVAANVIDDEPPELRRLDALVTLIHTEQDHLNDERNRR